MTVFANQRGVAHGGSNGQSVVMPDVCKTPTPSGPVPIPYTNVGRSADATGGPKSVTIEGQMPMVKGAKYTKSSGDEPGSAGGVVSGKSAGECEFVTYSFDVKIEGKNVCRLGDRLFHNGQNTVG